MNRFRYLPERPQLEALLTGAGVTKRETPLDLTVFQSFSHPQKPASTFSPNPKEGNGLPTQFEETAVGARDFSAKKPTGMGAFTSEKPFVVDDGAATLEDRLERLVAWVESQISCSDIFVADDQGLPLVRLRTAQSVVGVTADLDRALKDIRPFLTEKSEGATLIETDSHFLQLIWAETSMGRFVMGLTASEPLSYPFIQKIRGALHRTLH